MNSSHLQEVIKKNPVLWNILNSLVFPSCCSKTYPPLPRKSADGDSKKWKFSYPRKHSFQCAWKVPLWQNFKLAIWLHELLFSWEKATSCLKYNCNVLFLILGKFTKWSTVRRTNGLGTVHHYTKENVRLFACDGHMIQKTTVVSVLNIIFLV